MNISELKIETQNQLNALIQGAATRESVSAWAMKYVSDDSIDISDKLLWRTLKALGGADARANLESYLYSKNDFKQWLGDLVSRNT